MDSPKVSFLYNRVIFHFHDYGWKDKCSFDPCVIYMGVSKNSGTPKSSILIGFSFINHPFWGTPIFGNIHLNLKRKFDGLEIPSIFTVRGLASFVFKHLMELDETFLGGGFKYFFIFSPIWGRFPFWLGDRHALGPGGFAVKEWWLIFFRWVEATNQIWLLKISGFFFRFFFGWFFFGS